MSALPAGSSAGIAGAPAWLTPEVVLVSLGALVLLALSLLLLVRLLLWAMRPLLRSLDSVRLSGHAALSRRAVGWPRILRLLERDAAELLLILLAAGALFGSAALLFELAEEIGVEGSLHALDQAVFAHLQALRTDWLDLSMVAITEFGGARISMIVAVVVFAWLAWRRAWAAAGYWAAALIGARLCVIVLKPFLERARPASIYGGIESYSFPSGHAASSMVTYGFLAFLLCMGQRWRIRVPVLTVTAVAIVLIGLSRLYLGMHWLTDVLAGYALGLAWIALLATACLTLHPPQRVAPLRLAAVATVAALLAGAWVVVYRLPSTLEQYRDAVAVSRTSTGSGTGSAWNENERCERA